MKNIGISPEAFIKIGPAVITNTVLTTWLVMTVIAVACWFAKRRLSLRPSGFQEILEAGLIAIENTVRDVLPDADPWLVIPVIGTLWILIGVSNLAGLVPGLNTPTADINTTFAFAVLSFSMAHFFGIKTLGFKGYLRHYTRPSWVLLPFHIIAEATRTVALAVRLFGNMLSGEMTAAIILGIAGLLVPIPFALLHIVIGIIQAYIFGILTLVFIAGGIQKEV
ncbi:MAG: F0F1 ATP synthase subunit A [Actinomycetota bacterium]|nr:F0F1 ATP synthase subunit A [Actinomycetota bacterium]